MIENKKPKDSHRKHIAFTSGINKTTYFITNYKCSRGKTKNGSMRYKYRHRLIIKKYDKKNKAPYYRSIPISNKQVNEIINCTTDFETINMCHLAFAKTRYSNCRQVFVWDNYESKFTIHNDMRKKGE